MTPAVRSLFRRGGKVLKMAWRQPRGFRDYALSAVSSLARSERNLGRPTFLTVEPTTACDLRCPVCETGNGTLNRLQGQMTLEHFTRLVDRVRPHTNAMQIYFLGEPFLNRRVYEMIAYAKRQGIYVTTSTNGTLFDARKIVESGLDEIHFNIGGMTQATHETYRVRSDLATVLRNLKALVDARAAWVAEAPGREPRPKIWAGLIVMKHNEHEVEEFFRVAPTWGVDETHIVEPWVRDMEQAERYLPSEPKYWFYDRTAYAQGELRPREVPDNRCPWMYFSSVVTWNGNVLPCCRDARGEHVMGNVFETDFGAIWNGDRYRDFRRRVNTDQQSIEICRLCSSFPVPALYQIGALRSS